MNLLTDRDGEGRVFVSTYPTMMGLIDESADGQRRFGVGHFDLVIIDEAHRSVFQKYRAIFDYFDSLLVGLTATPKDEIDRNTYSLFDLETGVPTDAYSLEEAVRDGFLVPPARSRCRSSSSDEGIRYDELSEDEKDQWDALEWGDDGASRIGSRPPRSIKWLFNNDTVDKVLAHLMTRGHQVAGGDRLGKTIIFAKNQAHADFIAERFDANYPHLRGEFARTITFRTEYAQSLIDEFLCGRRSHRTSRYRWTCSTRASTFPRSSTWCSSSLCARRPSSGRCSAGGRGSARTCSGQARTRRSSRSSTSAATLSSSVWIPRLQKARPPNRSASVCSSAALNWSRNCVAVPSRSRLPSPSEPSRLPTATRRPTPMSARDMLGQLHGEVAAMNLDNFLVRPQRRLVERYAKPEAWNGITRETAEELARHVAGLPAELDPEAEEAKRFDLLMLGVELAVLRSEPGFQKLRDRVREIASCLEELSAIPMVREHMALIQEVQSDEWWVDVTVPMLERVRRKLRLLARLVEKRHRRVLFTDFEDAMGPEERVELPGLAASVDFEKFREKARVFLRSHEDDVSIRKLRMNKPLTTADLASLEMMLEDSGCGGAEEINRGQSASLTVSGCSSGRWSVWTALRPRMLSPGSCRASVWAPTRSNS